MRSATNATVATFGALAALAGIEHGIGEILQGSRAPDGLVIESWPDTEVFRVLSGEPAMTIVPNLRVTGILAILVSLIFLIWTIVGVRRRHGGLVLLLISLVLLLVGGGFGPPLLGLILGIAASRINAPLTWWRARLSPRARRGLSRIWPWSLVAGVVAWLLLMPGALLIGYFGVMSDPGVLVIVTTLSAFGLLLLTIVAGLAADLQRRIEARQLAATGG